jgi:hypothetical protein
MGSVQTSNVLSVMQKSQLMDVERAYICQAAAVGCGEAA